MLELEGAGLFTFALFFEQCVKSLAAAKGKLILITGVRIEFELCLIWTVNFSQLFTIDVIIDRDLTKFGDRVKVAKRTSECESGRWIEQISILSNEIESRFIASWTCCTKITEGCCCDNLRQTGARKLVSLEVEDDCGDGQAEVDAKHHSHVLQELEIEDRSDAILFQITSSPLSTAAVVASSLSLANEVLLVLSMTLFVCRQLARVSLIHNIDHLFVTETIRSIVGVITIHFLAL